MNSTTKTTRRVLAGIPAIGTRRRRRKANQPAASMTVTTGDMHALAGRLENGTAALADLRLAGQLVVALMQMLPADSTLQFLGVNP